jgi:mRNA interferase RelE/StbE
MTYQIVFSREFVHQFEKLDRPVRDRIHAAVDEIKVDPHVGKRLTGVLSDRWSYRVGSYRILYKIYQDRFVILALTVGHRKDIYR